MADVAESRRPSTGNIGDKLLTCTLFLLLSFAFATAVLYEYLAAMLIYPIALVGFVVYGALVGGVSRLWCPSRFIAFSVVAYIVGLLVLRIVSLSPVAPFMLFYRSIEPGMTEQSVHALLAARFPGDGRYARPVASRSAEAQEGRLRFILDPTEGRYDAWWIDVDLYDGRVKSKTFSPD